jgi:Protein of unknown function (DUF3426)
MMATNPKYPQVPENSRGPAPVDNHAHVDFVKKGRFPWVLIAILAAIAILVALIVWLPATPQRNPAPTAAQVPAQPTAAQIQLTNVKITPAPVGDAMSLEGLLHNQGSTEITGVEVRADFMGTQGQIVGSQMRPLSEITGREGTGVENFTKAPIKPNESRPFRVYFDQTPRGWNHEAPQLTVTTVTGTTP